MSTTLAEVKRHHARIGPVEAAMKAALAAHNAAWKSPKVSGREAELTGDLRSVRRQAALLRNPGVGEPKYADELKLWQDAEARWSGWAAAGMPPRSTAPDPMTLVRQRQQVIAHLNALAARGVHLSVSAEGELIARPSALLNEIDRQRLRENKTMFIALLSEEARI